MLKPDEFEKLCGELAPIMTPAEFAAVLRVSVKTVRRWVANGLPHSRIQTMTREPHKNPPKLRVGRAQVRIMTRAALVWLKIGGGERKLDAREEAQAAAEIAAAAALFAPRKKDKK